MQDLKILNRKEIKKIKEELKKQFGYADDLDYVFLINQKNRIYIVTKDLADIDVRKLRVNSYGLYLGESKEGAIRLGMDGSQLIGPKARKNMLELGEQEAKEWLKGYDLAYSGRLKGYVLLQHDGDFLGCGKVVQSKILNYVPKIRRMTLSA
jgi:NOL1/NOP2/fmu family ribosome biogenesis protein